MSDPLSNLQFKEDSTGIWLKFKADTPVKIRVWSVNPVVHDTTYTDPQTGEVSVSTKYAFAIWNFTEKREQVLDAGVTITRAINKLHNDEDYGSDITKVDVKISPTGEKLERRYDINVLPKPTALSGEQETRLQELDARLDEIVKNGIRAEAYNNGMVPRGDDVSLQDIPF